jgi:hypothetical protein
MPVLLAFVDAVYLALVVVGVERVNGYACPFGLCWLLVVLLVL